MFYEPPIKIGNQNEKVLIKYKPNLILTSKLKQTVNDSLISYISTIIRILYMIQMSFQVSNHFLKIIIFEKRIIIITFKYPFDI